MTCRHHQSTRSGQAPNGPRNRRGGAKAQVPHLSARSSQSGAKGRHQHGPTAAGIHANQYRSTWGQHLAAPVTHLESQSRRDLGSHPAADAIRAKPGYRRTQGQANGMNNLMVGRRGHGAPSTQMRLRGLATGATATTISGAISSAGATKSSQAIRRWPRAAGRQPPSRAKNSGANRGAATAHHQPEPRPAGRGAVAPRPEACSATAATVASEAKEVGTANASA